MSACPTLFIPLWENLAVDKHKNDYRVILPLTILFAIFWKKILTTKFSICWENETNIAELA